MNKLNHLRIIDHITHHLLPFMKRNINMINMKKRANMKGMIWHKGRIIRRRKEMEAVSRKKKYNGWLLRIRPKVKANS